MAHEERRRHTAHRAGGHGPDAAPTRAWLRLAPGPVPAEQGAAAPTARRGPTPSTHEARRRRLTARARRTRTRPAAAGPRGGGLGQSLLHEEQGRLQLPSARALAGVGGLARRRLSPATMRSGGSCC